VELGKVGLETQFKLPKMKDIFTWNVQTKDCVIVELVCANASKATVVGHVLKHPAPMTVVGEELAQPLPILL
jgi:hypothetical protein